MPDELIGEGVGLLNAALGERVGDVRVLRSMRLRIFVEFAFRVPYEPDL
jgi:hypothetical protein